MSKKEQRPPLRQYLLDGDFFIGATLATTLTKLALKYIELESNEAEQNRLCASTMLTLSAILHLGRSGIPLKPITNDDAERIYICLKTLGERSSEITDIFKLLCRDALAKMLDAHQAEEQQQQKDLQQKAAKIQADDPIIFAQLSNGKENLLGENVFESSLNRALAGTKCKSKSNFRLGIISKCKCHIVIFQPLR